MITSIVAPFSDLVALGYYFSFNVGVIGSDYCLWS